MGDRAGVQDLTLGEMGRALAGYSPKTVNEQARLRAAVALILHEPEDGPRILFIRRALVDGDPWSGHLAFPGGRLETADSGPRQAAERETREEVGVDLSSARYLGRLDDLQGRHESILVSCFVYALPTAVTTTLNREVDAAFWFPMGELESPQRHIQKNFTYRDLDLELPALRLLDEEAPVLWGMTYQFLENFLQVLGRSIPSMPWRPDL